jgi:hypothetical protein
MATNERGATAGDIVALAHRRLLADHSLQFRFTTPAIPHAPDWLSGVLKTLKALGPVLRIAFWIGLAALVLWLAVQLANVVVRRRRAGVQGLIGPRLGAEPSPLRPSARRAQALLEDADRLASEQRYDEAAHVLLFRTIADLESRRPRAVRPALTSRDIAALEEIPSPARGAFAAIARRVEHSFFGGRPLDADGFAACRAAYVTFASPASWAAGAAA